MHEVERTEPVAGERTGVIIGILVAVLLVLLVTLFWRSGEIPEGRTNRALHAESRSRGR